ncbi:TetR/AcrR family transcriptional regulator [Neotabrizicola shimadae]|uniref:TetR/AcrR family transcriptional regulator n=1 Tax=Neotabrizicola shimadae TaxID=2807096 RepID=A0A8G1EAU1_9RHOB|nr:TetR/AcrR family transcriptional regulator [Neotabrizicola shimadae]QYZ68950.1 TetR/AcrR family transcriptional regulator [Neotabrizicola shimadae]
MGTVEPLIRRGRKFTQVLDGARDIFLRDGFEAASVDEIARAAAVSKATLYSYFPDKRLLFMEVAKVECRRQAEATLELLDTDAPVAEVLTLAAERITAFTLSEFGQRIFRICLAEADRFPGLGREFYDSGPRLARERLVAFLESAVTRGELAIDDLELAADQFVQLCKAVLHDRLIFGLDDRPAPEAAARVVRGAVQMFMARYGAKAQAG